MSFNLNAMPDDPLIAVSFLTAMSMDGVGGGLIFFFSRDGILGGVLPVAVAAGSGGASAVPPVT